MDLYRELKVSLILFTSLYFIKICLHSMRSINGVCRFLLNQYADIVETLCS
jgi:hypothetical protein